MRPSKRTRPGRTAARRIGSAAGVLAITGCSLVFSTSAGAGGGISSKCSSPEVVATSDDDRVVIHDDRVELFDGRTLVRTDILDQTRPEIVVGTLAGDDEVEVQTNQRTAMVCTGTGRDEIDGGWSHFWVFAEGDLTANARFSPALRRFEVWGSADITTDGDSLIVVYGDGDIETGIGDDLITVDGEADIESGSGNDIITTGDSDDRVDAGPGIDSVNSGSGDDTIFGGPDGDVIRSGPGDDDVDGGSGSDNCDDYLWLRGPSDTFRNCEIYQHDPKVFDAPKLPTPLPGRDLGGALGF